MGIRGLQSYVENSCPEALELVAFSDCADEYRRETNTDPILIIDGYSCGSHFYKNLRSKDLHLGHYNEFGEYLMYLVKTWSESGIKCIFFFDGSPSCAREELWIDRRNKEGGKIFDIFKFIRSGQREDANELLREMTATGEFMKCTLRINKCNTIQTVEQADDEIIEYIAKNGCFGVLAQDTDYIIMEGVHNYFSAMHMEPSGKRTRVYRRKRLARALGINEAFLPLFATLSGNDITTEEDLRIFHLFLLRDHRQLHRLRNARFLPKREIIPRVGQWIRANVSKCRDSTEASKLAARIMDIPRLEQKLSDSVKSYLLPEVQQAPKKQLKDSWAEILEVAEDRHRTQGIHRILLAVMTLLKFHQGSYCEFFSNPLYPHSGFLHKKLRARLYGLLLKERPRKLNEEFVVEYICMGTEIRPVNVQPQFPKEHPGLLRLWRDSECTEHEKLKLFLWAVSEKIQLEALMALPQDLRVACVTIFFLANEVKAGLQPSQVQALVATVVCLYGISVDNVRKMVSVNQDEIELHICSQYIRTWFMILAVDDACGNPLLSGPKMVFFDGKLFNKFYKDGGSHDLYDSKMFDIILEFLNTTNTKACS